MEKQQTQRQQRRAATRSLALVAIGGITLTVAMTVTSLMLMPRSTVSEPPGAETRVNQD